MGYIATYPGFGESSTFTMPFDENENPSTSVPSQPPMVWPAGSGSIIPLANGTRTDCAH